MFFGKKRYENFDPSVETMRSKDSFNVYPVKRKWLKKKLKDRSVKEQVVEPAFINPYFSTSYNQMFYLCDFAEFATAKEESKRPLSLKDNLFGTTSSGKALRAGALLSLAGGVGLAVKNKQGLKKLVKEPLSTVRDHYTSPAGKTTKEFKWYKNKADGEVLSTRRISETDNPSFLGSGRKVNWGNVGKTGATVAGLAAVPVTAAYVFGDKKDREEIQKKTGKVYGVTKGTMRDLRTWINTLHRVSR
jgi:hypothetical protein